MQLNPTELKAIRDEFLQLMDEAHPEQEYVRDLHPSEFDSLGRLMVEVYSNLDGFPKPTDQPHYYEMLAGIGRFTEKPSAKVLVAISAEGRLVGGVVYFGDMAEYGSGGIATSVKALRAFAY